MGYYHHERIESRRLRMEEEDQLSPTKLKRKVFQALATNEDIPDEALEPLCKVLVEAATVETAEEATKLLVISPLLKAQSYEVQLMMILSGLTWSLMTTILNTESLPSLIRIDALPQSPQV